MEHGLGPPWRLLFFISPRSYFAVCDLNSMASRRVPTVLTTLPKGHFEPDGSPPAEVSPKG
jgi:hypothetical protein